MYRIYEKRKNNKNSFNKIYLDIKKKNYTKKNPKYSLSIISNLSKSKYSDLK
jgi:hypothetical protein